MPCVFLPHFLGSSVPVLVASAPSAGCSHEADAPGEKMGDAVSHQLQRNCSGLGVKILSKFHGGLAHFPQSNCSAVLGTTEELGQLSTEATSGPHSETRPESTTGAIKLSPSSLYVSAGRSGGFSGTNTHSHAPTIGAIRGRPFKMCIRIITWCQQGR